ncbi:hypothetical protein BJ322DRAFT_1052867 [Thelephora terrestris]|uniref:Magnesium transporter n=1 Tax=Thelephora terrestris TaxID=56493 RepID=A0A9P6HHD2_9AGAM|nr:hypothetical protein BJ322DRAFT_1052867 [Thelephora terrestris]
MHPARLDLDSPKISIAAGIIVGLLASFIQSLGLTVQRKSHIQNQALPEDEQKNEYRRPLWLFGFGIFISSNILGSLFQIASLPVVILAPLGAVSLLWNAFFARLLLGDLFSTWMILGTILIAGGAVLIAVFGTVPEPTRSLEDLLILFNRPAFVIYFSLLGFFLGVVLVITHISEWTYSRRIRTQPYSPPLTPAMLPPTANPITTTTHIITETTPLIVRKSNSRSPSISTSSTFALSSSPKSRIPLLLSISYASASGILSGMCLLFAKSGVELLLLTIGGDNQFWRWQAWLLIVGLCAFALLQLWYLHKALILENPTLVCPLAFCFYNLSSIVNGLVYFDQLSLIPWSHLALVGLGIIILLGGVWIVSFNSGGGGVNVGTWRDEDSDEPEGDGSEAYEEASPDTRDRSTRDTILFERSAISESDASNYFTPDPHPHPRTQSPGPTSHTQNYLSLSQGLDERPNLSIRTGIQRRRQANELRSPVQAHHHHSVLSPQLPGLSIGISPASPGFVVVPRERRRKVSGVSMESQVRRSQSEGDIFPVPSSVDEAEERTFSESADSQPPLPQSSRWSLLRRIFKREDKAI